MKVKRNAFLAGLIFIIGVSLILGACSNSTNSDTGTDSGKLMILQAYGTGSGGGLGVSHSFVELYNSTSSAINLAGYTLWYADGTRNTSGSVGDPGPVATQDGPWKEIALTGTIPAKGSFLILGDNNNAATARLQIPANSGDMNPTYFNLSNRAFKVALIKGSALLTSAIQNPFAANVSGYIDMVGSANTYGTGHNDDMIYGYETAPARNSGSEAVRRWNLTDTDDNSEDFIAARYAAGGLIDEEVEVYKPRNASAGKWNPFQIPGTKMLMILQFGAATDGNISRSFVELYNNTDAAINLDTYSIQYSEGHSTNSGGNDGGDETHDNGWIKVNLSKIVQSHNSFLILGPEKTTAASDSPPALKFSGDTYGDIYSPTFELNNRAIKIALMSNQTKLDDTIQNPFTENGGSPVSGYIDMVGATNTTGTDFINGYEGTPITNLNKQAGQRRKILVDTNNNAADFARATFSGMVIKKDGKITTYSKEYEIKRPKNRSYGAWNPITGEKE